MFELKNRSMSDILLICDFPIFKLHWYEVIPKYKIVSAENLLQTIISHDHTLFTQGIINFPESILPASFSISMCNELGVCQGPISHNNEQTQSVEGII